MKTLVLAFTLASVLSSFSANAADFNNLGWKSSDKVVETKRTFVKGKEITDPRLEAELRAKLRKMKGLRAFSLVVLSDLSIRGKKLQYFESGYKNGGHHEVDLAQVEAVALAR